MDSKIETTAAANYDVAMESRYHFKNEASLKSLMSRKIFLLAILLLPISLSAQIRIAEDRPSQPQEPDWWKYKDIPYDSSYLYVKFYPTLDAYKKYIGQQLYLPSEYIKGGGTRGNSPDLLCGGDKSYVNKYFTVIDILSVKESKCKTRWFPRRQTVVHNNKTYYFTINDENIAPYFVLEETQSGNIVYTAFPESFILVGCFVKLQQKFLGSEIFELTRYEREVIGKWICSDVTLKVPPDGTYNNDIEVNLILQNVSDNSIEKTIRLSRVDLLSLTGDNDASYLSKEEMDERLAKIANDEKQRKEKDAAFRQEVAQIEAKRKQELTNKYGSAMAEKIIAGKLEIGMSKAVCLEIIQSWNFGLGLFSLSVADKTATTETLKYERTYLYFRSDKLERIENR